jgi:phage-related protein
MMAGKGVKWMVRGLIWVGSSQKDFSTFPEEVKDGISDALYLAQKGEKAANAKPLKGFLGASVLEVIERDRSGTYRCVYVVKFRAAVYVLHVFQKKSHKGIATPHEHLEMIKRRLKLAGEIDAQLIIAQEEKEGR